MRGTKTETMPGVWRLRVYVGRLSTGSPRYASKTVHTGDGRPGSGSRTADRELAKLVTQVTKGNTSVGVETVSGLVDRWLDHCENQGRSPTTLRKYRSIAETVVCPELGSIRLTRLKALDLDRLYGKLTAKGNKPATVRRVHALISASLRQAEKWDLVDTNVARKASPPPVHLPQVEAPSVDDVVKILRAAEGKDPTMARLIFLAALTGARRGELCGLRWTDIDWSKNTLTIERSVYEKEGGGYGIKGTKTHQERRITLGEAGVELLKEHREHVETLAADLGLEVGKSAFIFSRSPEGTEPLRPDFVTKFVIRTAKAAGVKTHLQAMRHFSATEAIGAGFDPVTVSNRLGHADPSITLRVYAHALEQRDRELADSLGNTLTRST